MKSQVSRPTTDRRVGAYRVAYRASLSHLRSGCPDCVGGLCPLARQIEDRADRASAALPYDALSRINAETFADDDDDGYGPGALAAIVVAALSGLLLVWWPLYLALWPTVRAFLWR